MKGDKRMKECNAPKSFWKYYDLFRRKKMTLNQFVMLSKLPEHTVLSFLKELGFSEISKKRDEKKRE